VPFQRTANDDDFDFDITTTTADHVDGSASVSGEVTEKSVKSIAANETGLHLLTESTASDLKTQLPVALATQILAAGEPAQISKVCSGQVHRNIRLLELLEQIY